MRSDTELLVAYVSKGDGAAFAELAQRHGEVVYRTCLRVLASREEAEDASQATFLVLLHKARSLSKKGDLAGWLHGVARNVALCALRTRGHRAKREEAAAVLQEDRRRGERDPRVTGQLDLALAALPAVQRQAVVLRYLEGYAEREAAEIAGCPRGTLSQRASRGLAGLRARLSRSGAALSSAALIGALEAEAAVSVPAALLSSLAALPHSLAAGAAAGAATAGGNAAMLADAALKAMALMKIKIVAGVLCAATVLTGAAVIGVGVLSGGRTYYVAPGGAEDAPGTRARPFGNAIKAAALLEPGDRLVFRAGTYRCRTDAMVGLAPTRDGEPSRPIVFKAHPGESVLIDASGSNWGFTPNGRSHVIIDGFEIRNTTGYGVKISAGDHGGGTGSDVTVRNCRILDTRDECILAWQTPRVRLENCLARGSRTAHGVSIQAGCDGTIIRRVTSAGNADNGITIRGSRGVLVEQCLIQGNCRGLQLSAAQGCTFSGNVFFNNAWRGPRGSGHFEIMIEGSKGEDLTDTVCRDSIFEANTVAHPGGAKHGLRRLVQVKAGSAATAFRNNVFYARGTAILGFGGDALTGHTFADNCLFSTTGSQVYVGGGVGDLSLSDFANKYGLRAAGNITVAPQFMDVGSGDLHLKAGSPAAGRGATLPVGCSLPAGDAPLESSMTPRQAKGG